MTAGAVHGGVQMAAEMAQQPEQLRRLAGGAFEVDRLVRGVVPRPLHGVSIVARGQQLARGLSLALGFDPDAPAGLSKVTMT